MPIWPWHTGNKPCRHRLQNKYRRKGDLQIVLNIRCIVYATAAFSVWRTLLNGAKGCETQVSVFMTGLQYFKYNLKQVTLSPCLNTHRSMKTWSPSCQGRFNRGNGAPAIWVSSTVGLGTVEKISAPAENWTPIHWSLSPSAAPKVTLPSQLRLVVHKLSKMCLKPCLVGIIFGCL